MILDQNKLKVKYILGTYKDLEKYPTGEDILYDILSSSDEGMFVDSTLQRLYINASNLVLSILELEKEGYIKIEELKNKKFYTILKNPFI